MACSSSGLWSLNQWIDGWSVVCFCIVCKDSSLVARDESNLNQSVKRSKSTVYLFLRERTIFGQEILGLFVFM